MNNQKVYLVIVAFVVLVGGGLTYYFVKNKTKIQAPVACTMEAKLCPDGSSVGRTGANCEFAACPVIATSTVVTPPISTTTVDDVATTAPSIVYISPNKTSIGEEIVVTGKNLSGFEGDKNIWIVDNKGKKGIIYGNASSTENLIKFKLPTSACQSDVSYSGATCPAFLNLVPGTYSIYVAPWGIESNKISFMIK